MSQFLKFLAVPLGVFLLFRGAFLNFLPGFHFDEVWFAGEAWRIASEPSYWPTIGMNAYTFPNAAYLLAFLFKRLGYPDLEAARIFYLGLSGLGFCFLAGATYRVFKDHARAQMMLAIFAVLPLGVMNDRLFIEVTLLFSFCLSVYVFGLARRGVGGRVLCILATLLGVSSHILFLAFPVSMILAGLLTGISSDRPRDQWLKTTIILCNGVVALWMMLTAIRLPSWSLAAEALGLSLVIGIYAAPGRASQWVRSQISRYRSFLAKMVLFFALPGLILFFVLEWSGFWPALQMTGEYRIAVAALFLLATLGFLKKCAAVSLMPRQKAILATLFFQILIVSFTVYKPSNAKYWEIPAFTAWAFMAFRFETSGLPARAGLPILIAAILQLTQAYAVPVMTRGVTGAEFKVLGITDTAYGYRQVSKALHRIWSEACAPRTIAYEPGRTAMVGEYLVRFNQLKENKNHLITPRCEDPGRKFWIGRKDQAPRGFAYAWHDLDWGDIYVYEGSLE